MFFDDQQYTSDEIEPNGEKIRKFLETDGEVVITRSNYNENMFFIASISLFIKILNEFLIFYVIHQNIYQNQQLYYWGVIVAYDLFAIVLICAIYTKFLTEQVKFVFSHTKNKIFLGNRKKLFLKKDWVWDWNEVFEIKLNTVYYYSKGTKKVHEIEIGCIDRTIIIKTWLLPLDEYTKLNVLKTLYQATRILDLPFYYNEPEECSSIQEIVEQQHQDFISFKRMIEELKKTEK